MSTWKSFRTCTTAMAALFALAMVAPACVGDADESESDESLGVVQDTYLNGDDEDDGDGETGTDQEPRRQESGASGDMDDLSEPDPTPWVGDDDR